MPKNREGGGEFEPKSPDKKDKDSDLSIDNIRGAAEELKRKVATAKQAKEQDIEKKVGEHDQMNALLLNLRELLGAARETRDYFTTVKEAGELPPDSEEQLREIESTVADLEAQMTEVEGRINFFASQPDILDRIHETALKMRDGERKEEIMKQGIENLTKENESIADEIKALAQELQETLDEHESLTQEYGRLRTQIDQLLDKAMNSLDYPKHGQTINLLDQKPTVEQLRQRRNQLGKIFYGREKAAIDLVLKQVGTLGRYHELRDRQKVLHDKIWDELRTARRDQLIQRIKEHMAKAWELHEQTGIKPDKYEGIDVPWKVFADLESRVKALGGIKLVERYGTDQGLKKQEEVVDDSPAKKQIRDLWNNMNSHDQGIRTFTWFKPSSEPKGK